MLHWNPAGKVSCPGASRLADRKSEANSPNVRIKCRVHASFMNLLFIVDRNDIVTQCAHQSLTQMYI